MPNVLANRSPDHGQPHLDEEITMQPLSTLLDVAAHVLFILSHLLRWCHPPA
jgi:hypothetical protein